jgi:Protein of unknown function (DUF1697)
MGPQIYAAFLRGVMPTNAKMADLKAAFTAGGFGAVLTIVRSIAAVEAPLASDPYADFGVPSSARRVVTFLRGKPARRVALPVELDGARILW